MFRIFSKDALNFFLFLPVTVLVFVCILAETHRRPFDFTERASELVCGFHTEYGGLNFTLLFISEYMRILFMGVLFRAVFFNLFLIALGVLLRSVGFVFIWVRGTVIRFRYDLIIMLRWKVLLPMMISFYGYFWFMCLDFD